MIVPLLFPWPLGARGSEMVFPALLSGRVRVVFLATLGWRVGVGGFLFHARHCCRFIAVLVDRRLFEVFLPIGHSQVRKWDSRRRRFLLVTNRLFWQWTHWWLWGLQGCWQWLLLRFLNESMGCWMASLENFVEILEYCHFDLASTVAPSRVSYVGTSVAPYIHRLKHCWFFASGLQSWIYFFNCSRLEVWALWHYQL